MRRRSEKFRLSGSVSVVLVLALGLLTGCAAGESAPSIERTPFAHEGELPTLDVEEYLVPHQWGSHRMIAPGWDTAPQHIDDVFMAPVQHPGDDALTFSALDSTGEVLWSAQRPLSCVGFTLTHTPEGRAIAVLTDVETSDSSLATTTASAYDAHTGEEIWGPVEVPGPHVGPGLVYAAPPADFMGVSEDTVVLDPATGDPLQVSGNLIGQFDHTLVTYDDAAGVLHGVGPDWHRALQDVTDTVSAVPEGEFPLPDQTIQISVDGEKVLLDVTTGEVVMTGYSQIATDPISGMAVTLTPAERQGYVMRSVANGDTLWELSAAPEVEISGIGAGIVFVQDGSALRAHNLVTGDIADAYPPHEGEQLLVPVLMSEDGAGLLTDYEHYYLAVEPKE